jgi:hypothetical protein
MSRYAQVAVVQIPHKDRTAITKCRCFSIFLTFESDFVTLIVAYGRDILCTSCLPLGSFIKFPSAAILWRLAMMMWWFIPIIITFNPPRKGEDVVV